VKNRPAETAAGVGGAVLTIGKLHAYLQANGTIGLFIQNIELFLGTWTKYYSTMSEKAKQIGWDGVAISLITFFFLLKLFHSFFASAGAPTEYQDWDNMGGPGGPGGPPPGGGGGRPSNYRPYANAHDPGLADLGQRVGNFQNIAQEDSRPVGAGGTGGTGSAGISSLVSRSFLKLQRMRRKARNPMDVFQRMYEAVKDMPDWPLPEEAMERIAGDYLAEVYSSGRLGIHYARAFVIAHGLAGSHLGALFERIFMILDEMVMFDNVNVCNAASAEILCRWAYGLEKALEDCGRKEDWSGEKNKLKTKWDLFERYDVWSISKGHTAHKEADAAVGTTMKQDALFLKYLDTVRHARG